MQQRYTVGIDEVGRGALAGPVVVVAAMVTGSPRDISKSFAAQTLKDSKKMSAKQREVWCARFAAHPNIAFAVACVYPRQIEKRNISGAANLAALRAFTRLDKKYRREPSRTPVSRATVFLDGGLYLGRKNSSITKSLHAQTIIKADEKIPAVAIASIIAKVHRDRFMKKLAKHYPAYHFEIHKGYGTRMHREALLQFGSSTVHRQTFLSKIMQKS